MGLFSPKGSCKALQENWMPSPLGLQLQKGQVSMEQYQLPVQLHHESPVHSKPGQHWVLRYQYDLIFFLQPCILTFCIEYYKRYFGFAELFTNNSYCIALSATACTYNARPACGNNVSINPEGLSVALSYFQICLVTFFLINPSMQAALYVDK